MNDQKIINLIETINEFEMQVAELRNENAELKKVIDDQATRLYEQKTAREQKLFRLYEKYLTTVEYSYHDNDGLLQSYYGAKRDALIDAAEALAVWEAGAGEILEKKE